ncbi:AAA family ATPase [Fastidiosibacter lacustris]|uniref:AAA family ATPase n=1 Tax=Fastidiosibacter lacustris TaxID=2056695 RepID=UPI000E351024|nr:AAA family ATPase [Fastidiosibacter lacustris]
MSQQSKTHAKDYLVDFSQDQCDWLKLLIFEAVNTNGKISDGKLDEIYSNLKSGTAVQQPSLNTRSASNTQIISIKKLEHISGVNALAANQTIKFSEHVTVLYGLNGAGKSSYFKVLNEIVGGNEQKELLSNIHADQNQSIQVKLTYNNGSSKDLNFDNTQRGFDDLLRCKVFDSSYLAGLLSQRTQDETVLEPLGLHIFKYIADKIDAFKLRLRNDADRLKGSKPSISLENVSDQLKGEFEAHNLSEASISSMRKKFVFTEEQEKQLKEKTSERTTLRQTNYADRITLLEIENKEVRQIYNCLKKKKQLETKALYLHELLKNKRDKESANKQALEKIAILKELPFSGSAEWKGFISAGAKLKQKSNTGGANCIYCNQPLQDDALRLVQAYSEYLGDKTESELKKATDDLTKAKGEVNAIAVSLNVSDNFSQKYKEALLENTGTSLTIALDEAQRSLEGLKSHLIDLIDGQMQEQPRVEVAPQLCLWLVSKYKENARTIRTLKADDTQKNEKIKTLENELKVLMENESVSTQQAEIESWLKIDKEEKLLREKESEINTNSVTRLSNTAHDELLTSELNKAFKNELDQLGYKNLEVNLVKAEGGKGSSSTKLILENSDSIHSILSEGEQKAVGLALFIAEAVVQKSKAPIILDDPVNSLDHKIAANFANRLLALDNQLIIFNHNRLFQDAFETAKAGHICKTVDSACNKQGKHILVYTVSSEGKSRKGVLSFYRTNTFNDHIGEAKQELQKSPFTEHSKVSAILRKAVECLVDETVLNGVTPTKYSNKNSRIPWDKLTGLNCSSENIEKMRKVHDRVSGGDLHNGTESENNPIDVEEFNRLVSDLENVTGGDS